MFPAARAAPFARNVIGRGVWVISRLHFQVCYVLLSFLTVYLGLYFVRRVALDYLKLPVYLILARILPGKVSCGVLWSPAAVCGVLRSLDGPVLQWILWSVLDFAFSHVDFDF